MATQPACRDGRDSHRPVPISSLCLLHTFRFFQTAVVAIFLYFFLIMVLGLTCVHGLACVDAPVVAYFCGGQIRTLGWLPAKRSNKEVHW